eukprot:g11637.t1
MSQADQPGSTHKKNECLLSFLSSSQVKEGYLHVQLHVLHVHRKPNAQEIQKQDTRVCCTRHNRVASNGHVEPYYALHTPGSGYDGPWVRVNCVRA